MRIRRLKNLVRRKRTKKTSTFRPPELNGNHVAPDRRYATLAPSGHNTQPWRFHIGQSRIDIRPDLSGRTPVVDPDDHHLFVSLGCAAENLLLPASARGRPGQLDFEPANGGAVVFTFGDGPAGDSKLVDAIPKRQSTRTDYHGRAVSAAELKILATAAAVLGVDLVLITDRPHTRS